MRVPGSKSVTNRALVLAALADGPSRLRDPLRARDTMLMAAALRVLGVGVADDGPDWVVTPAPLGGGGGPVDVGLAGTVQRFVPPVAALAAGPVRFDGDPRPGSAPLAPLLPGLRCSAPWTSGRGGLPLTVHGAGHLPGGSRRRSTRPRPASSCPGCCSPRPGTTRASGSGTPAPARCRARCRSA